MLIKGLPFAIQQFCLATGLVQWDSDIAEEQQSGKRTQAVQSTPRLPAEGIGSPNALGKSHVRKCHVTTHPPGQVTEMQQEQQAFIARFSQSIVPELLWQHLNQNCFLITSRPMPSHHSPLSSSTFSPAHSYLIRMVRSWHVSSF